jgi:1,4-dihydroxy-2-naphthoyl-CoA synthase
VSYEHLLYEQRGPVTVITINRPQRMNSIGPQTPGPASVMTTTLLSESSPAQVIRPSARAVT